jgi:eukaryotic-like serine/threonine-protein kinase
MTYALGEVLGCGGMGQVYASRDRSGRKVAVKRVHDALALDARFVFRLIEEATLMRLVDHPNVVRAVDLDARDGLPVLVMDHAPGEQLGDVVAFGDPLPIHRIATIAAQLLAGVAAIHDAGVVHGDLKSSNILVDELDVVTIIDFGLARRLGERYRCHHLIGGTPAYMAPELIDGAEPTISSDLYAAATVVYELLTATTPYTGHVTTVLARQLAASIEPPSKRAPDRSITAEVDRVLRRALSRSPTARPKTVRAFARELDGALATMVAPPSPRLARGSLPPRQHLQARGSGVHVAAPREPAIADILHDARSLAARGDLASAATTLELALAHLPPNSAGEAWRIETELVALRLKLGQPEAARRIALCAFRRAIHSGSPIAATQTLRLVERHARTPNDLGGRG